MIYREGTLRLMGDGTVIGQGTAFRDNVPVGAFLTVAGFMGAVQVARVISDTELMLARPMPGLHSGSIVRVDTFAFAVDFTPTLDMPFPNRGETDNAALVDRALKILDDALI